jgi:putative ABC transport system permease protein
MPPETLAYVKSLPEVEAVDTFHEFAIQVEGRQAALAIVEGVERRNLQFQDGNSAEKNRELAEGKGIAVTESFARKFGRGAGSEVLLATSKGAKSFRVIGVYRDYTRDEGVIMIDRKLFSQFWNDQRINSLAVFLKHGANPENVTASFRQRFSREGEYAIYPNAMLRKRIFAIFDQTFAVTSVLRVIAVVVAGIGIFLSVTTAVTERNREIGILRSMGASTQQVRRLFLAESGLIGTASSALGIACGCCLAVILTSVVNRVYFGWTIDLQFPWGLLASTPFWIIPAALAAAWLPAWKAARQPAAAAVRME